MRTMRYTESRARYTGMLDAVIDDREEQALTETAYLT